MSPSNISCNLLYPNPPPPLKKNKSYKKISNPSSPNSLLTENQDKIYVKAKYSTPVSPLIGKCKILVNPEAKLAGFHVLPNKKRRYSAKIQLLEGTNLSS